MTLRGLPTPTRRECDLPPLWDGHKVDWSEWDHDRIIICPPPKVQPCACGSVATRMSSVGTIHPLPGEVTQSIRTKRLKSGRVCGVTVEVPAWPILGLHVERCPDCRLDTVFETGTGKLWELDSTDYGPDGSSA